MKLIVGLGNPGREYEKTRHNIGFMFLDSFAESLRVTDFKTKFNGSYAKTKINGEDVLLLKPLSYMNLSGEVVSKFVRYFNIDISDILVISDDLDLYIGNFKLKQSGSSGGHNGLKNIELHLHTPKYKRLKIGISNDKKMDTKDYVLGKFGSEDMHVLKELMNTTNKILNDFVIEDFNILMSKYNCKNGMKKDDFSK